MSDNARQAATVTTLPSALRRVFPDFVPLQACTAVIPLYSVRLTVEVLAAQRLSQFATYVLHAVGLGVATPAALAVLLGIEVRDLAPATVELLKYGYLEQGPATLTRERILSLTDAGRKALADQKAPPVPRRRGCRLHLNALTGQLTAFDDAAWSLEQTAKEGVFVLPVTHRERPTLGEFALEQVGEVLRQERSFADQMLVDLLELKEATPQYLPHVAVYLLSHRETNERRVAAIRSAQYLVAESEALQQLLEHKAFSFPAEVEFARPGEMEFPALLPASVAATAEEVAGRERSVSDLEARVQELETARTQTQDRREREELQAALAAVNNELAAAQREMETMRDELRQQHVEFLRTEEHREVLERALREARREVVIISPWMNRRACDDALCDLMAAAIARGVRIRIGYGMGRERTRDEAALNRHNIQEVRRALLSRIASERQRLLQLCETSGTHQKILVCDRAFAVAGSFNWLSYRGERDFAYRSETGILVRHPEQVAELAALAEEQLTSGSTGS